MEKLILRGVMWGADKIPDPWFEKIPGGYYKAKEEQHRRQKSVDMKKRRSRRHSDDEYEDEDSRPDRDDGYRSEGHGRHSTLGKSLDGPDDYDSINNRPRRKRSKPRRHRDDDDRYGYDDGYSRRERRHGANGVEYGSGVVPPEQQAPQAHPIPPGADPYVAGAAAAAAGAAGVQAAQAGPFSPVSDPRSPQQPPSSSNHFGATNPFVGSTSTLRGGMATGYVPYAHIYGGPQPANGSLNFAPPPSDTGSIQPNYLNQVAAPVAQQQGYVQNPYAQEAPPGSQPGYMPDPHWNERQYQNQHREHNGRRERHRRDDYESSEDSYSPPRSRRSRRSRRDRSYSRDRYSDDDSHRSRRARSERPPNGNAGPPARGPATVRQPHYPPPPPVFVDPHKSLAPQMAYPSPSPPHSRMKEEARSRARSGYSSN